MLHKALLEYIEQARLRHMSDDLIRHTLLEAGWKADEVDHAMALVIDATHRVRSRSLAHWIATGIIVGMIIVAVLSVSRVMNLDRTVDDHALLVQPSATIAKKYLLPIWYVGRVTITPKDPTHYTVHGELQTTLAPMRNAKLSFQLSDGFKIQGQAPIWAGTIDTNTTKTLDATVEVQTGFDHGFVTLAYDFDFPADELIGYLQYRASKEYSDDELRNQLIETIDREHRGRTSAGTTEEIKFTK